MGGYPALRKAEEWLEPDTPAERLLALAGCAHAGPFDHWPVSRRVNNGRNDEPDLLRPLGEQTATEGGLGSRAARRYGTTAEPSSMVHALVSWDDDDPTDPLAAGWWLHQPLSTSNLTTLRVSRLNSTPTR